IRITDADGHQHGACVLVADTEAERERGLMDVDGLGGYDGMLFRFPSPTTADFYMFRTRLPLSIAFFAADGTFVSGADMTPCTAKDGSDCPLYPAAAAFLDALEVAQGGLPALGIGTGSHLQVVGAACSRSS